MEGDEFGQTGKDKDVREDDGGIAPLMAAAWAEAGKSGGNRECRREAEAGDETPADHSVEGKDPAKGSLGKTEATMKEGCELVCDEVSPYGGGATVLCAGDCNGTPEVGGSVVGAAGDGAEEEGARSIRGEEKKNT